MIVRHATFTPGDIVATPLGRRATVVRCRHDGKLELRYVGPRSELVTMSPALVRKSNASDDVRDRLNQTLKA